MTPPSPALRNALVGSIPSLRAFAISLCRNRTEADDLVQETLIKAWNSLDSFQEGTNLKAWLFRILRNNFYNVLRKQKQQNDYARTADASQFVVPASQDKTLEFADLVAGLRELPADQREALILVAVENMSYEDAAAVCDCPIGTIKSRVNRARARLDVLMNGEPEIAAQPKP
jgi:RNA polymerase sigma-70 factor (ECF subfamily)